VTRHSVTVRHTWEAAHRLPHLPGKCQSLHGHSWAAAVTVTAPELAGGMLVEFGPFKAALRAWIDDNLDHGAMLGPADPLTAALAGERCKVFPVPGWPTVENIAALLAVVAQRELGRLTRAPGAAVACVRVRETPVNEAAWHR
jgi:6-pyruvoyltetrahydropterin/6-carboxytetrahydropterin synthase